MSLVAQCLRGSGPVPRSKSHVRLKARENKLRTPPGKQGEERREEWKTQRGRMPCLTWCHHVSHHVCALCAWLQSEDMEELSMEHHGRAKQLVMFFGAASIGTRGGWGADVVLRACCKVVCRPRGTDQRRGRMVFVYEHRTTRVSSAVNGQQP
ncbi:hypothetical protein HaLaN_23806, partial [Haematococcus lacustris]